MEGIVEFSRRGPDTIKRLLHKVHHGICHLTKNGRIQRCPPRCTPVFLVVSTIFLYSLPSPGESHLLDSPQHKQVTIPGGVSAVAWSPDGQKVAAASDYGQKIYIISPDGNIIRTINRRGDGPEVFSSLSFIDNTNFLFGPPEHSPASTAVAIWNSDSGVVERLVDGPQPGKESSRNRARDFAICGPSSNIVTDSLVGLPNLSITSVSNGYFQRAFSIEGGTYGLACSPGRTIAIGARNGSLALLDLTTGILSLHKVLDDIPGVRRTVRPLAVSNTGSDVYISEGPRSQIGSQEERVDDNKTGIQTSYINGIRVHLVSQDGVTLRAAAYIEKPSSLLAVAHDQFLYRILLEGSSIKTETLPLNGQAYVLSYSRSSRKVAVGTSIGVDIISLNEGKF